MPGYEIEDRNISCLAFADDLFLIASDAPKAQNLLDRTVEYLGALGMTISTSKSLAFEIRKLKDSWGLVDPGMERHGERLPSIQAGDNLTYLGVQYLPWSGIDVTLVHTNSTNTLLKLSKLPLKPHEKLCLLQKHLVPHYLHQLVLAVPAVSILRWMDQELRVAIKQLMHLPACVCNGLIYYGKGDGSLGFPKLEELVTRVSLGTGLKFANSRDSAIRALYDSASSTANLRRLATSVRLPYPYTLADFRQRQSRMIKEELQRWSELTAQCRSVKSFAGDKVGNSILYNPTLLKPCRFITALQLRTNTAGNRTTLNRAVPQADLSFRKFGARKKTLTYIAGECIHTKAAVKSRHNEIIDLNKDKNVLNDKAAEVIKEPEIQREKRKLKPHLVLKNLSGVSAMRTGNTLNSLLKICKIKYGQRFLAMQR
jgi:hypothetical protein